MVTGIMTDWQGWSSISFTRTRYAKLEKFDQTKLNKAIFCFLLGICLCLFLVPDVLWVLWDCDDRPDVSYVVQFSIYIIATNGNW